ncbi:MAG: tetratricopeptide repeat protein, partial [Sandaracinaceae bacterium]|nr:tetratricopeptide repeat protein [Sandaracinaceae bacterium]
GMGAEARDTFERLARIRPLEQEPLRRLSYCQLSLRDDDNARGTLTRLLKLAPDDLEALASLAGAEERLGHVPEAVAAWERLLMARPDHEAARRAVTLGYFRLSRDVDVVSSARLVLDRAPGDVDVLFARTRAFVNLGRTEDSLESAKALVAASPQHLEGLRILADAAITLKLEPLAVDTLERALVLDGAPADVRDNLVRLLRERAARQEQEKLLPAAVETLRRLRQLAPDDPAIPFAIARCQHVLGRAQEALDLLRENVRTHKRHAESFLLLARLYEEGGYTREAAEAYRNAVTDDGAFDALAGLGFTCAELGLVDEAIDALTRASRARPSDEMVRERLAALHERSGHQGDAIQSLIELGKLRPLDAQENRRLGLLCAAAGRTEDSVVPLERALESTPADVGLLEPLAAALETLGRDPQAASILARLASAAPNHPDAASRLGFAWTRLGKFAEAATAFETARVREVPRVAVLDALANAHAEMGDLRGEIGALAALADLQPTEASVHRRLGLARHTARDRDGAIEALSRAHALGVSEPEVQKLLAELLLSRGAIEDLRDARPLVADDASQLMRIARAHAEASRTRDAVDVAREVLRLSPATLEASLLLGRTLASEGDSFGAAKAYEQALEHRVDAIDALQGAAQAYVAIGRDADAATALRRVVRIEPQRVEAHRLLSATLLRLGETENALTAFAALCALSPDDVEALTARGELATSLGRWDEARTALEHAHRLNPESAEILGELVEVRREVGLSPEALDAAERLARVSPTDARALARLGEARASSGRVDEAIEALSRALALDATLAPVRERLGRLLFDRAASLDDLARATELLERDPEPALALARAQAQAKNLHEAIGSTKLALSRRDDHVASWIFLGELQARLSMHEAAAGSFGSALRNDRNNLAALLGLGASYLELGRPREAADALGRAIELKADSAEAHAGLAQAEAALGRTDDAIRTFLRLGALRPLRADELRVLGRLEVAAGRDAEAAKHLRGAVEGGAVDRDTLLDLATALERSERPTDAVTALERAAEIDPGSPIVQRRLGGLLSTLGRHDPAVAALLRARGSMPNDPGLLEQLADGLLALGRKVDAVEVLGTLCAVAPGQSRLARRLGDLFLELSREDDAQREYERALALPEPPPDTARRLAALHRELGGRALRKEQFAAALSRFEQSLVHEAEHAGAQLGRARALIALAREEDAIGALSATLSLDPASLDAALLLGDLLGRRREHQRAVEVFEAAHRRHPQVLELAWGLARSRLALGQAEESIAPLRATLSIDPAHVGAKRRLARVLEGTAEAKSLWSEVVEAMLDDGEAHQRLGAALAADGDHEGAVRHLGRALRAAPDDADLQLAQARSFVALSRFADAAPLFHSAIAKNREDVALLGELADVEERLGHAAAALEAIEAAVRLTRNADAHWLRRAGRLRLQAGPPEVAADLLHRSLSIEPHEETRQALLGLCREQARRALSKGENARPWLLKVIKLDPREVDLRFELARLFEGDGNGVDAWTHATTALELDPTHPGAALFVGEKLAAATQHTRAVEALGRAAAAHPNDAPLQAAYGRSLLECGRILEAATALERGSVKSSDPALFELVSATRSRLEHWELAAAAWQRVVELGRRDVPALLHLGELHERAGQHESAWHAYQQAFQLDQRDLTVIRRIAQATEALGRGGEAVQWLELAVGHAPRDAELRCALARCHLRLGQRPQALQQYEAVCQLDHGLAMQLYREMGGT